jgi:hypothetical protein
MCLIRPWRVSLWKAPASNRASARVPSPVRADPGRAAGAVLPGLWHLFAFKPEMANALSQFTQASSTSTVASGSRSGAMCPPRHPAPHRLGSRSPRDEQACSFS